MAISGILLVVAVFELNRGISCLVKVFMRIICMIRYQWVGFKISIYIPTSINSLKLQKTKSTLELSNLFLLSLYVLYLIQCQWIYIPIDNTFSVAKNV